MNRAIPWLLLSAATAAWAGAAAADDIRATSAIESVLVFPYSADITRTGEVRIPAGEHRVIFTGLPQYLDPNSLRIRFGDPGITVGAVEAVSAYPEGGGPEQAQALRDELQAVQDQIQAVDDRIATAELQIQFLQGQTLAPKAETGGAGVNPGEWSAALAAIEAGSQDARAAILQARQERRALERRAQEIQLEVDRVSNYLAMRTDVQVALTAEEAVTTPLLLEYQVQAAGWGALYEARLDSEAATLTLDRKIQVYQSSGEDWTRVRLAVSTAPPTNQLETPYVWTHYLNLMEPEPAGGFAAAPPPMQDAEQTVVTGARIAREDFAAASPVDALDSTTIPVASVAANFASRYSVGGLVDVASDNTPRTFTIGQEDIDVELVVRAAPRSSTEAFVVAKLTYAGDGPLPPGSLRLYRDGAYLTSSYLDTLVPDEELELGFGQDQQILVTWVDEAGGKESETGLIGRSTQVVEDHRFEVLNRHSTPFTVEIIDYRPIAQDGDIQIRVGEESTPPDETEFDDRPGVLLWRKELAPDETFTVRNAYTIVHPTNEILVGR